MRGLAIRLGVIGAIALGAFILRPFLTGAAVDLAVGDCFDLPPADQTEVEEVQHRPCTDDHQAEVFFVQDMADGAYPGDAGITQFISDNCVGAFTTYTGRDYMTDTELDFTAFTPTAEGWSNGDQEITCFLYRIDEAKFKGSLKAGSS